MRIVAKFWNLFNKNSYWIDHPCVFTNNHGVFIGREYWLKERTRLAKKVIVKRVLLNIDCVKLKVLSVYENKSYWISQSFEEQYWSECEWRLIDNFLLESKN
jgi:hypothetical protein